MKTSIQVDVGAHLPGQPANSVAIDVHVPERLADEPLLFFCLPGGGVTKGYFDLDGGAGTDFSFARAMIEAGHVVAAADPVGVGDSTRPEDGLALTVEVEADLMHRAFTALRAMEIGGIALGALRAVGTGHSAGAMLSIVQQATYRDFSAMALFCFGTAGLPQYLDPEQKAALGDPDFGRSRIVEFARRRFGGTGYSDATARDSDTPASRAQRAVHTAVLDVVGMLAMTPGSVRKELATVDVPVFLGVAERDMTGPPYLLAADYAACPDFTLFVLPTGGHHVFVAPGASGMFRRVVNWAAGLGSRDG